MNIQWNQKSTWRGLVWLIGGVATTLLTAMGKDTSQIIPTLAAVAGALGVFTDDSTKP